MLFDENKIVFHSVNEYVVFLFNSRERNTIQFTIHCIEIIWNQNHQWAKLIHTIDSKGFSKINDAFQIFSFERHFLIFINRKMTMDFYLVTSS